MIFAWDGSVNDLNKWLDKENQYEISATQPKEGLEGRTISGGNGYLVYIVKPESTHILHHECIHLAMEIFRDRGIKADEYNHEHMAYYSGMWFEQFHRKLKGKRK